jgi:hypothetical protein
MGILDHMGSFSANQVRRLIGNLEGKWGKKKMGRVEGWR